MPFCYSCGAKILEQNEYCKCGLPIKQGDNPPNQEPRPSKQLELKSEGTALVLAILLGLIGLWGIGQIYCSRIGRGIAMLIFGLVIAGINGFIMLTYYSMTLSNFLDEADNVSESSYMIFFLLSFGIIYVGFFFYQIFDARALARNWNEYVESHNGTRPW